MSAFLTDDEVRTLTGYTRYSRQRSHLDRHGIHYIPAASGRPIVPRTAVDGPSTHMQPRSAATDGAQGRALLLRLQREAAAMTPEEHDRAACSMLVRNGPPRSRQIAQLLSIIRFSRSRHGPRGVWAIDPRIGDRMYDGDPPMIDEVA